MRWRSGVDTQSLMGKGHGKRCCWRRMCQNIRSKAETRPKNAGEYYGKVISWEKLWRGTGKYDGNVLERKDLGKGGKDCEKQRNA